MIPKFNELLFYGVTNPDQKIISELGTVTPAVVAEWAKLLIIAFKCK